MVILFFITETHPFQKLIVLNFWSAKI